MSEIKGAAENAIKGREWGDEALRDKANRILRETKSFGNIARLGRYLEQKDYKYYEFEPTEDNNGIKGAVDNLEKKIYVNADLAPGDKHFTLAVEIARSILSREDSEVDYRKPHHSNEPREIEANVLAYELVMPAQKFLTAYQLYFGNVAELSKSFLVPEILVKKRIAFLQKEKRENKRLACSQKPNRINKIHEVVKKVTKRWR